MITTKTITIQGYKAVPVYIEADLLSGPPTLQIVGLPDASVKESRERLRSAFTNSGFYFPVKTIIINLAPNDIPKNGSIAELAICCSLLGVSGQIDFLAMEKTFFLGSISLSGKVHAAKGATSAAMMILKNYPEHRLVLPEEQVDEIKFIPGLRFSTIQCLADLPSALQRDYRVAGQNKIKSCHTSRLDIDFADIIGHEENKMGLSYSAIGEHHTLLFGAPGAGKTLLGKAMSGILSPLDNHEALEVSEIYSVTNQFDGKLIESRPFRTPHHSISDVALVGGGSMPIPGEVSLAHRGILFLDELVEFTSRGLQALRQPLEDRIISVARARGRFSFPADFTLVAATNPCQCGYYFTADKICNCGRTLIDRLHKKIVGPFLDRITLELEVVDEKGKKDLSFHQKESAWFRDKIIEARLRMLKRNHGVANSRMQQKEIYKIFYSTDKYTKLIDFYCLKMALSHRGLINSLRLAISITDFHETDIISEEILDEAFSFRKFRLHLHDRKAA